ncbi:TIR domain-containing protein [Streptomyces sp. NPDC002206]
MLLLKLSARDLLTLNLRRRMVPHLAARWKYFRGSEASLTERSAWAESVVELAKDLVAAGRGNVEMVVECSATVNEPDNPDEARRIDVVLVGRHPETRHLSLQFVELKRWSTVTRIEAATAEMVHVPGMGQKKHPALQLRECYDLFTSDAGPLSGLSFECDGFTYLHNATDESVRPLIGLDAPTGVLTAEDTTDEGHRVARQNVIHEIGLFQGRHGFDRVLVLAEDGCATLPETADARTATFPHHAIDKAFWSLDQALRRSGFSHA